jgi:hypothetical protein
LKKSGKKGNIFLEKRKSPKYLLVMLKSGLVKLIKLKRVPIPKSPPQAPKISDVSRIWMIQLRVASKIVGRRADPNTFSARADPGLRLRVADLRKR